MKKMIFLLFFLLSCNKKNEEILSIKLVTNRDYFQTVRDQIRLANQYVYFSMFVARIDGENQVSMLFREFVNAKEKGIEIKILLDSSSYDDDLNITNGIFAESLQNYGISVKFDDPDTTTHCKFGIFDGKSVIVGSTNWTYSSLEKNNEVNIFLEDEEIASELKKYFEKIWGGR